jgi:hypothetical protein
MSIFILSQSKKDSWCTFVSKCIHPQGRLFSVIEGIFTLSIGGSDEQTNDSLGRLMSRIQGIGSIGGSYEQTNDSLGRLMSRI